MESQIIVHGIHPDRLYTSSEVAELLGLHPDTIYRIPASRLRRTFVGPRNGRTLYLGCDLIAYLRPEVA